MSALDPIIETLEAFNVKVDRLERSGFAKRFNDQEPEVIAKFDGPIDFTNQGDGNFTLSGKVDAWMPDYNEDEVDAIVLTYRILTQNNDRLSLASIAKIYDEEWFPEDGKNKFNYARDRVNEYLESPATVYFEKGWITNRSLMEIIIYGGLAHTNKNKQNIFDSWMQSGASGFFKVEFVASLRFMLYYFRYFKELNEVTIQLLKDNRKCN